MTLYAWGRPRAFPRLPPAEPRLFDVAAGTRVLAHCHWQPRRWEHPTLIALHGLESSSDAHYVRGLADKAFAAGFNAVRLNQRNCGATEHLSDSLYHSGLTGDPIAVMRELIEVDGIGAFAIAGYSLGGNLALKLAGDFGAASSKGAARRLCCVADDGSRGMRRRARGAAERDLSVALRQKSEAADAAQGRGMARQVEARRAAGYSIDTSIRRCVYSAASWLSRRRRLLRTRQRNARDRARSASPR